MSKQYKILIADDEPDIREFLKYTLEKSGFIVVNAEDGRQAIETAIKEKPDLILLDIMMPIMDGVEACSELRDRPEFKKTIIAFLSARSEDYSQIAGFEVGADDFINKPIRPKVLVARLNALLRRNSNMSEESNISVYGRLTIDKEKRVVVVDEKPLYLPKKEYEILCLLTAIIGKVYTREEIYKQIWGYDVCVGDRTIDVHMRKIREKLGDDFIMTVKGVGYKFNDKA